MKYIKYSILRKYNLKRSAIIYNRQKKVSILNNTAYLTIFHDYEGKYAFDHVEALSIKGINEILKIENEYKIKATYNIVGKLILDKPDIAKAIILNGHELASHSYDHRIIQDLTKNDIYDDISKSKKLFDSLNLKLTGFRSPQGRWSFKQMNVLLKEGLNWTAERDTAEFPYILIKNNNKALVRMPVGYDDWGYKAGNVNPNQMFKLLKNKIDETVEKKKFIAIGFHPWVQGESDERILVFRKFIDYVSKKEKLKIKTFGEMYNIFKKNII